MNAWYVARTKAHREIATAHVLAQRGLETYVPMLPPSTRRRTRPAASEALFPGYLFARMDVASGGWLAARSAPGILYFLGGDDAPTPIPEALIDEIAQRAADARAQRQEHQFKPGQPVVIQRGPFTGLEAIFDGCQSARGRVRVLLEIVHRLVPVILDVDEIAGRQPRVVSA